MKALFFPKAGNPYQYLLASALTDFGVRVTHHKAFPKTTWIFNHRNTAQVVHLHWPSKLYKSGPLTPIYFSIFIGKLLLLKFAGYKIVWTVHNILPHDICHRALDILGRLILANFANAIIVHCDYAKRKTKNRFFCQEGKIHTVPHGNYALHYSGGISPCKARDILNISSGVFVYLFFGKILPYKGIKHLLDAFGQLRDKDVVLLIVGECHPLQKLALLETAQSDPRIKPVLRYIHHDEVPLYFSAADVLVSPFLEILTSGSVILGLTFGLPVIAPSIGCLPETITEGSGILYDPSKSSSLLKALLSIRAYDTKTMGQKAYEISQGLDWKSIAEKTYRIYSKS